MTSENTQRKRESNRRSALRRRTRGFVKLECRKGALGLGANVALALLDLSETGVRLIVKQQLLEKQDVEIILSGYGMPRPIKRLGKVCWQLKLEDDRFCLGVEFEKRLNYIDWQNLAVPN